MQYFVDNKTSSIYIYQLVACDWNAVWGHVVAGSNPAGDRVVQLWAYHMGDKAVRGVDVMRVESGEITEKFGYVKVV